jgi:hypothetical protein
MSKPTHHAERLRARYGAGHVMTYQDVVSNLKEVFNEIEDQSQVVTALMRLVPISGKKQTEKWSGLNNDLVSAKTGLCDLISLYGGKPYQTAKAGR